MPCWQRTFRTPLLRSTVARSKKEAQENRHMFRNLMPSHAPRKTYRDIADGFDRMGMVVPGLTPGYPNFLAAGLPGGGPMDPAYAQFLAQGCAVPCCPPPVETVGRVTLVGFPRVCIEACGCETIETSVCGPFTLTNLFIPSKIACSLAITRFRVGCWDMLVNCDPVPAELFSCCELDENMFGARPVDANSPICITVENDDDDSVRFEGAVKGVLCEPC